MVHGPTNEAHRARGGHGQVVRVKTRNGAEAVKTTLCRGRRAEGRLRMEAVQLHAIHHVAFPSGRGLYETPQGPVLHMDWIDGVPATRFHEQALSVDAVILLAADVCRALSDVQASHALVHRDIKPANLMIDTFGRVNILDLGCARSRVGEPQGEGELLGTLAYMAPERLGGGEHGSEVDVYGVGLVALELLCARRVGRIRWGSGQGAPRVGSLRPIVHRRGVHHALHAAEAVRSEKVPGRVQQVLWSMLSWEPSERPSLDEAARELAALVKDPVAARAELGRRAHEALHGSTEERSRVPVWARQTVNTMAMMAAAMLLVISNGT